MTNLPIPSISKDGKNVRTAGTLEEPLFLAKDVVEGVGAAWKGEQTIAHVPTDFRVTSDVTHPKQGVVKAWYLNELGLYFYLNRSDSPLALPWQIKVAETLRAIRQQTFSTSPDLEARLEIAEAKLQIFEEHCPAKKIFGIPLDGSTIRCTIQLNDSCNTRKGGYFERSKNCCGSFFRRGAGSGQETGRRTWNRFSRIHSVGINREFDTGVGAKQTAERDSRRSNCSNPLSFVRSNAVTTGLSQ